MQREPHRSDSQWKDYPKKQEKKIHAETFCRGLSHKWNAIWNLFAYNSLHSILLMFYTYGQVFYVTKISTGGTSLWEHNKNTAGIYH